MNANTEQTAQTWNIISIVLAVMVVILNIIQLASPDLYHQKAYVLMIGIVNMGAGVAGVACGAFRSSLNKSSGVNWSLATLWFVLATAHFVSAAYI